jgi:hypothetical protein
LHFTAPLADDLQMFLSTIEKRSTRHTRR